VECECATNTRSKEAPSSLAEGFNFGERRGSKARERYHIPKFAILLSIPDKANYPGFDPDFKSVASLWSGDEKTFADARRLVDGMFERRGDKRFVPNFENLEKEVNEEPQDYLDDRGA
jgi:hypothetical protein